MGECSKFPTLSSADDKYISPTCASQMMARSNIIAYMIAECDVVAKQVICCETRVEMMLAGITLVTHDGLLP